MKNLFCLLLAVLCFACGQEVAEPEIEARNCEFDYLSIEIRLHEKEEDIILYTAPKYIGGSEWDEQRTILKVFHPNYRDSVMFQEAKYCEASYRPSPCDTLLGGGLTVERFVMPKDVYSVGVKVIQIARGDRTQSITKIIR